MCDLIAGYNSYHVFNLQLASNVNDNVDDG